MNAESQSAMGLFERYLSVWVALCILAGVGLGVLFPALFSVIAAVELRGVALLIPMECFDGLLE